MHALIRGKDLGVNQDYQTQKNITHKKAAHIEAHFLRLLKKIWGLILGGESGRVEGRR